MDRKNKFIVVSYYTKDTGYQEEIKNLIESMEKFKIEYDIEGNENRGSWHLNTHYKSIFIRKMLDKHYPRPVVWVDADAVFLRYPDLFNTQTADFACYYRYGLELLSGTTYFANNGRARKLLDLAIMFDRKQPERSQQYNLKQAVPIWIREHGGQISYLPVSYCKIFDVGPDPVVIQHNQASRKFREAVRLEDV